MEPTEKELEDRLRELGTRLASPPSDVDELLCLLDQTEIYLSRVEQSPSTSMSDALCPTMNSLITKEFLNHPEADVKVYVAACINEIMRVTAPDAPYNDDLMKEIFAMIVDAFEKLDDMSGCSYCKRVSILEIMAKVRSCVVMLDLECDDLILRMFENFLKSIRTDHPINVFSSMETIMTLILEESEDISQELLSCLLSNVQKSKKGVMPVVRRLAEKVISNCYMKLKPYIVAAVQSIGTSLSDYSDIVASIRQDSSVALEKNEADGNKLSEKAVSDALPQETEKVDKPVNYLEEVGAFSDKARKVLSNGVVPLGNGNAVVDPISPKLKPENSFSSEQCRNGVPSGEHNSLGSITEKPGNELNFQSVEEKLSSVQLTDASDSSWVDDKEVSAPPSRRAGWKKEIQSLKSDGASDMVTETEVFLEGEREAELQPLEGLDGDNSCVNSAAPTYKAPVSGLPMRKRVTNSEFSEKRSTSHKPAPSAEQKKMSGLTIVKKEDPPAIASIHKDHFLVSVSDGEPSQDSTKKSLADNASAELAVTGVCDGKSLRKEKMETESLVADANTFENQGKPNTNRPEPLDVTDKDLSAEPCLKEMMASSKASREEHNDHNRWVKFAGGNLKKKGRRKAPRLYNLYLEIIGREIEVWWPDDKKFYKGVIDAFDPVTEKHRVVYDDGDVEILFLRNERWNYVDSKNFEKELENDVASPESSLQAPRKKRRRASSGKRKSNRERGKFGRKSKDMEIQQSVDGNSTVKSRDSPIETTSELATSLYEKTPESLVREETKLEEPSHINNLDKTPDDTSIIKDNILASGGDKSVIRSRGRRKGDSLGKKSNTLPKDEGTEFEYHQTKNSLDDPTLVDAGTSTGAKLDGKSKDRRKLALKSRVNPIGETLKSSRILNEETLKTTSNEDKEIKIESSQTKDSDNTVPYTTAAFKHGLIIDTDQNLKGKETLKLDNMAIEDPKGRRKRKRTVTTIDTNVSAIENLDDLSQSSSAKTNKRRRK
ncbi:uncharacterized protein LOC110100313 isoform X1 [Dendrobium catenatum]|uniref:uncharacterized protein LOC110100313 isoform X1 n=1 Tax=Dendrobium catenatum TaxID=906689 RepID=UPI0010A05E90|nr:uncharacterized protein LOC110100313 isoform X1 [Dendrobium catenatum]